MNHCSCAPGPQNPARARSVCTPALLSPGRWGACSRPSSCRGVGGALSSPSTFASWLTEPRQLPLLARTDTEHKATTPAPPGKPKHRCPKSWRDADTTKNREGRFPSPGASENAFVGLGKGGEGNWDFCQPSAKENGKFLALNIRAGTEFPRD